MASLQKQEWPPNLGLNRLNLWVKNHPQSAVRDLVNRPDTFIHIVGTNGKGSTSAGLAQGLRRAGFRVALFTSPHLVDLEERLRINGVPQKSFTELFDHLETITDLSFFERTVAAAIEILAKDPPDYIVWEAGLGGRFDGTNIITRPKAVVFTSLGIDHTEFLGETLEKIAGEKLAVAFGKNVQVITTENLLGWVDAFVGKGFGINGGHRNEDLVATTLKFLLKTDPEKFEIIWPGRFTQFPHLLVDGAHNQQGIEFFIAKTCRVFDRIGFGCLEDKDPEKLLSLISPWGRQVDFVLGENLRFPKKEKAEEFLKIVPATRRGRVFSVEEFLASCEAKDNALVGSLYLVGEVFKHMGVSPWCP